MSSQIRVRPYPGLFPRQAQQAKAELFRLFREAADDGHDSAMELIVRERIDLEALDAERLRDGNPDTLLSLALRAASPMWLNLLLRHSPLLKSLPPADAGAALLCEAIKSRAPRGTLLKAWRLCQSADCVDVEGASPLGLAIEAADAGDGAGAAIFLLERGADPDGLARGGKTARELAQACEGSGSAAIQALFAQDLAALANAHMARSQEFDKQLVRALSTFDLANAWEAISKGAALRWGDWGSAQEPAAFETADAAAEALELLRPGLHEGRLGMAWFFLLETPMTRAELFMEAMAADCQSAEIFAAAIGGPRELSGPWGSDGSTLLMEAARRRNVHAIEALLARGADCDRLDRYGQSARALAPDLMNKPNPVIDAAVDRWAAKVMGEDAALATLEELGPEPIEVFGMKAVEAFAKRAKGADQERVKAFERCLAAMLEGAGRRNAAPPPDPADIERLAERFPTFSEAIELAANRAATSIRAGQAAGRPKAFKLPNLLLVGRPGMGKTRFLRAFSDALGVDMALMQMGATSAGFVLAGMDSGWSGAKPGKIFEALAFGAWANPVFVLDELDKASADDRHPVAGPLFSLLERGSARDWRDEFTDAAMDASHINYFATANDLSIIDEAILSRFLVIDVPEPLEEESLRIAFSVYREALETEGWGQIFDPEPSGEVLARLASGTPREANILLSQALPKACAAGRSELLIQDFKPAKPARRGIGFTG
jgi:ATP-dependent Lon protease